METEVSKRLTNFVLLMYKHLISTQRSQIFAYKHCNKSAKFIADAIGVHVSTIYRELSRNSNKRGASARNIPDRTSIKDRPPEADGKRFGDWEMDLIIGKNGYQAILVLVERSTGYVIIHRLKHGKKAKELAKAVGRLLPAYKAEGVLTTTTDNGSEFSQHRLISKALNGVTVYFADPYSSWQKGLVEYTNKLIRQFIPKGSDFDEISPHELMQIQKKLNARPRKKLNFSTPKIEFFKHFS